MPTTDTTSQARTAKVTARVTREEKRKLTELARVKKSSISELLHEGVVEHLIAEHDRLKEFLRTGFEGAGEGG